jgi:pyruvate kinase
VKSPGSSRRTKILATLGPASREEDVLGAMIDTGVDGVRLNFAYGTHQENRLLVESVRRLAEARGRHVAIVQDLAGPKIRVGGLSSPSFEVRDGEELLLATPGLADGQASIPVDYDRLTEDVQAGHTVLLGDGEVELRVEEVTPAGLRCRVVDGGPVRARQGVTFPDTDLVLDAMTEKDIADAHFGIELGVDYMSLSFVRSARDIEALRSQIRDAGAEIPVIAKLERRDAVANLEEIIAAADGVMVARGDLGLQMQLAEVPLLQKRIIREANRAGKVVITATQMMESMVQNPRPTRAEVSDVANAVLDGTDVVMLSGETAVGAHPLAVVRSMAAVLERVDPESDRGIEAWPTEPSAVMALSARQLAAHAGAVALVVFTRNGYSAWLLATQRPPVPVLAFTPNPAIARRMALWRGVEPMVCEWPETPDEMLATTERLLKHAGFEEGDIIVLARWSSLRGREWTNFVHLHRVG